MELDELSKIFKVSIQPNSIVIFKVPQDKLEAIAGSCYMLSCWKQHNISPLFCPDDYEIVVVPGSEVGAGD